MTVREASLRPEQELGSKEELLTCKLGFPSTDSVATTNDKISFTGKVEPVVPEILGANQRLKPKCQNFL